VPAQPAAARRAVRSSGTKLAAPVRPRRFSPRVDDGWSPFSGESPRGAALLARRACACNLARRAVVVGRLDCADPVDTLAATVSVDRGDRGSGAVLDAPGDSSGPGPVETACGPSLQRTNGLAGRIPHASHRRLARPGLRAFCTYLGWCVCFSN